MLDRRTFSALVGGVFAAPRLAWSRQYNPENSHAMAGQTFFYVSLGPALRLYRIDAGQAALIAGDAVKLPAKVQYAWPHPSVPFLYVASSNGGSSSLGIKGDKHYLSALRID